MTDTIEADRLAFLAKILETPDDDTPRLVYADKLRDLGQWDFAEFIDVQCQLAVQLKDIQPRHRDNLDMILDPQDGDQQRWKHRVNALRKRESELLESFRWNEVAIFGLPVVHPSWSITIDDAKWSSFKNWDIFGTIPHGIQHIARPRSGFIAEVMMTAESWLELGDSLTLRLAKCERCGGAQKIGGDLTITGFRTGRFDCPDCSGTRPLPPAAQPITDVHLMTWQDHPEILEHKYLEDRWPGIRFHLPPTEVRTRNAGLVEQHDCEYCNGTGEERVADAAGDMDTESCRRCDGTGVIRTVIRRPQ